MLTLTWNSQKLKNITEEGFKKLCKEKVKVMTFEYLISKQIRRKPNHLIKYERFEMAKYLQENNLGYSVKEKQIQMKQLMFLLIWIKLS